MPNEDPFRILLVGDFGPDAGTGTRRSRAKRSVRRVDRDDLDKVIAFHAPRVRVPNPGGEPDVLGFGTIEDFDVERIAQRAPSTATLLSLRDRLAHPDTFEQAAREAGLPTDVPDPEADLPPSEQSTAPPGEISLADVLAASDTVQESEDDWAALARDLVRDEVERIRVPGKPAGQDHCIAAVEAALQVRLREILRDPGFRSLEAAWRGVRLLTKRLPTDSTLSLHVLDLSRDDLGADVGVSGDFDDSTLYRRLVEETVGTTEADPWSLVVGLHEFGATPQDVATLLRVGRLAGAARAPFVAAARPNLFGCVKGADVTDVDTWKPGADPLAEQLWAALRSTPESGSLALVWPRVLLRSPRGESTSPVEEFPFEELGPDEGVGALTWGCGALVAALLLGEAFARAGWGFRQGGLGADVDDLPTLIREIDGERALVPCAEALLRGKALEFVTEHGAIPLLSHADRASVRLGGLHSLSATGAEVAGRWL